MDEERIRAARALAKQIEALLAGRSPDITGAVLAEMLAVWLIRLPADKRAQFLGLHVAAVARHLGLGDARH